MYSNGIYIKWLVKLQMREIYVFYNGREELSMIQELKLSNGFIENCDTMELKARVMSKERTVDIRMLRCYYFLFKMYVKMVYLKN